jgi:predicted transcriptional regulator
MEESATITALDRMLDPLSECFNTEVAQRIVALRIDPTIQARIAELADRSNEGLLTEVERAEYDSYVEGAEILSLIKLKARRYLIDHGGD